MALLQPKLIDTLPLYQLPIATVMLCNKATKKYMTNNHSLLPVTLKSSGQFWSQLSLMKLTHASLVSFKPARNVFWSWLDSSTYLRAWLRQMGLFSSASQGLSSSKRLGLFWAHKVSWGLDFELLLEATVTSAAFYWPKQVTRQPRFKVEEADSTS